MKSKRKAATQAAALTTSRAAKQIALKKECGPAWKILGSSEGILRYTIKNHRTKNRLSQADDANCLKYTLKL